MKAIYWSAAILLVAFALCLGMSFWTSRSVAELQDIAQESVELIREERYVAAIALLEATQNRWNALEPLYSMMIPHNELTGISTALRRFSDFAQEEDREEALAAGEELVYLMQELQLRELPILENVL